MMSEQQSLTNGEEQSGTQTSEEPNSSTPLEASTQRSKSSDPLDQIAELLAGEQENDEVSGSEDSAEGSAPDPEPGDGEAPEEEASEEETFKSLKDVAAKLDVDPAKLYELDIPMGDGESLTLGELKDAIHNQKEWTTESAQRELEYSERGAKLARDQQELAYLRQELVGKVDPAVIQQAQQQMQVDLVREQQLLTHALPKFKDPAFYETWRNQAVDHAQTYGFRPEELQITDHRMIVMMADHMKLKDQLKKLASVKPTRKQPPVTRRKGANNQAKPQVSRRHNTRQGEIDQVAQLLKGR